MPSDDELAQTATAPARPAAIAKPAPAALGRFRIERELGEGGMGVVHAAFDPELERRVALKVLRRASDAEARARLLREARAMAKLSHPNAVTVFEVGSAGGDDFIAMELVDGDTLGAWLARERPRWREILGAFLAAGRALAAAHAESMVHRDFKPSNVLRSRGGRIVVTDFGLALLGPRTSDLEPPQTGSVEARGPRPEAHTRTGAVVGTPAYMAPEQWTGGEIGPAADQFAFCVALWEALAGQRPYRGDTLDDLRTGVLAGPARLEADAIPRALRPLLVRGLAVDPARRWPSMTALLAALERVAGRRRRIAFAASGLVVVAAAVFAFVTTRDAPADACGAPAIDPAAAWSPARIAAITARSADAAQLIGDDIAAWHAARARACFSPPATRSTQLACLDATLVRLDAAVSGALHDVDRLDADGFDTVLVEPSLCMRSPPPRLAAMTPELASAMNTLRRATSHPPGDRAEIALLAGDGPPPCARMLGIAARLAGVTEGEAMRNPGELMRDLMTMRGLGASCNDDALQAMAAIAIAVMRAPDDLARADALAQTFPQTDVLGALEQLHAETDIAAERWDAAWKRLDHVIELASRRHLVRSQLEAVEIQLQIALDRGRPEDLARAEQLITAWRPRARHLDPERRDQLERRALRARWRRGDVAGADRDLERLGPPVDLDITEFIPGGKPIDVEGDVVDETGAPVPGATVVTAPILVGDSARIASPVLAIHTTSTTADASGHFTLERVRTMLGAQLGDRRSRSVAPARHVRLVVEPTGTIAGHVDLAGKVASHVWVLARTTATPPAFVVAPVRADGEFTLSGALRGELQLSVTQADHYELGSHPARVVLGAEPLSGVALAAARRQLHVVARSRDLAPPDGVIVWVFAGYRNVEHPTLNTVMKDAQPVTTFAQAGPASQTHVPDELRAQVAGDDYFTTLSDLPDGELMVCGLPYANKQLAATPSLVAFGTAVADDELACARVAPDQTLVTMDLPSVRKLPAK